MNRSVHTWLTASAAAALALGLAPQASAAITVSALPQALATAAIANVTPCNLPVASAAGLADAGSPVAATSKGAAILGGAPSALERMRLQQAGAAALPSLQGTGTLRLATPAVAAPISTPNASAQCAVGFESKQAPSFIKAITQAPALGPNDFLASKRLLVSHTSFDDDWSRVGRQTFSRREATRIVGNASLKADEASLASVNAWVNRHVRYVEDKVLYGRADMWAPVRTTLNRRAGDCEDIAIAKMQLLAALGVPRENIYLTVARDLVRNADHAVLVVKMDGRHWLLDNSTDTVLDASTSHDYRAILSFSTTGKWLHGYPHS